MNSLPGRRRRSGIIFVTALWVVLLLSAIVLLYSRSMRTELTAASNRQSLIQVSAIELGAEQYVISAVDGCQGDAVTVLGTPAEQIQLGNGYFWILQPYYDDDQTFAFGITDEASKLNINVAGPNGLATLPGNTIDVADSIIDWRDADSITTGQGAESDYYERQPRPYDAKNSLFESVEELYLVKNVDDTLLYGFDLDHNGVLDANESAAAGLAAAFNSASDSSRGIFPFITVWGTQQNTTPGGRPRVNVSNLASPALLRPVLQKAGLTQARINQISVRAATIRTFRNPIDFAVRTGMTSAEFDKVANYITTSTATTLPGLVNINTAPAAVLMCLSLTTEEAQSVVSARGNNAASNTASSALGGLTGSNGASGNSNATGFGWIMDAIAPQRAAVIGGQITGSSYFYSADIVAVTDNGRGFKRVRIVVDGRSSPPAVIYRKDLTYLGWPLDPQILSELKKGHPPPAPTGQGTGGANGLSSGLGLGL